MATNLTQMLENANAAARKPTPAEARVRIAKSKALVVDARNPPIEKGMWRPTIQRCRLFVWRDNLGQRRVCAFCPWGNGTDR